MKRLAIGALVISTAAIAVAFGVAFFRGPHDTVAAGSMIFGIAAMAVSLMALGGLREGDKPGIPGLAFAFLFIVLVAGFSAALLLPVELARADLWLGLPRRAAIVVYGVGVLPVLFLPLVYAHTFESRTLGSDDLERIRAASEQNLERALERAADETAERRTVN